MIDARVWLGQAAWCVVGALCFATACGDPASRRDWRVGIDTLSNGAVLVVNFPPQRRDRAAAWRVEEELRIGGIGSSDPRVFVDVRGLAVDDGGRMFVLDAVAGAIRLLDRSGAHVRTLGEGEIGPLQANGMALAADGTLWVPDVEAGRMIVLDTLGAVVARHEMAFPGAGSQWQGGFDVEGHLYDVALLPPDSPDRRPVLRRFGPELELLATYPLPRPHDVLFHFPRGATRIPFAGELRWMVDPRGFVWLADTGEYRIYKRTLEGDTVLVLESWREPLPVAPEQRDSALAHLDEFMELVGDAYIDLSLIPETWPVIENIDLDSRGRLWVRVTDARPNTTFEIFETTGVYLASAIADFRVPEWRHVIVRDSSMYAVTHDDLGVPYVIRARISRRH